ncbi:hypothetical protein HYU06_05795 [Candidatus Woesearchaeota archaeon]|nr:hypothetical protein [Candidatus Woesearchaeota archaeon]
MAITLATISDQAWTTLRNHLTSGTYALSTSNVHGSYNDKLIGEEGYPQVTIYKPKVTTKAANMDLSFTQSDVQFLIEVFHLSGESAGTLADEVHNKIWSGRSSLADSKLFVTDIDRDVQDIFTEGSKTIHVHQLIVNFVFNE